jgi:hypothetical protein
MVKAKLTIEFFADSEETARNVTDDTITDMAGANGVSNIKYDLSIDPNKRTKRNDNENRMPDHQ